MDLRSGNHAIPGSRPVTRAEPRHRPQPSAPGATAAALAAFVSGAGR